MVAKWHTLKSNSISGPIQHTLQSEGDSLSRKTGWCQNMGHKMICSLELSYLRWARWRPLALLIPNSSTETGEGRVKELKIMETTLFKSQDSSGWSSVSCLFYRLSGDTFCLHLVLFLSIRKLCQDHGWILTHI